MALTEAQRRQAARNQQYWADREAEALRHYIADEQEYDRQLRQIYQNMMDACQDEIDRFYGRYAGKEGITIAEAKKRVSKLDIAAYERKAKRYVKDKDFSPKANEEMRLYNLTMKVNRLEMLKANIGLELVAGHDELEKFMGGILKGRTEEELQRQAGILGETIMGNARLANVIPNASFHNATFSDRIWMYQDLLKADISKLLQSGLIQGKNARVLARELKKTFDTSTYNAERLMRTELARVQTEAQRQSFVRNGYDEYTFHVNGGCCDICLELNGKHFKVSAMQPGENAPPMHPHCRCSTSAYRSREEFELIMDFIGKGGTLEEWGQQKKALEKSVGSNIIKAISVNDIKEAIAGTSVKPEVAEEISKVLQEFNAASYFLDVKKVNTGESVVLQTEPEMSGRYARIYLNINEDVLGGKSLEEINALFAKADNTAANSFREAVIHEIYHAKLIQGLNFREIVDLYQKLDEIHIEGFTKTAYVDGAECIAEAGVLIERGEASAIPKAAYDLLKKYIGG